MWWVLAFSLLGSLLIAFFGHRQWKKAKLLIDTEIVPVADLRPGFCEVQGKVVGTDDMYRSPWGRKACVYYEFEVEERRGSGDNERWVTLVHEEKGGRCRIDDGTGQLELSVLETDLDLNTDDHEDSGTFDSPPEDLRLMLERDYGVKTKGLLFNKKMTYSETVLEEGDEVYAIGAVRLDGDVPTMTADGPLFILSDKSEEHLTRSYKRNAYLLYGMASLVGVIGCGLAILGLTTEPM